MIKKQIPNFFTLLNLLSGIFAIIMALSDRLVEASFFIMLGIFFDFFDGFFARILKVQGELGKELDSLADMVTSGVAPGLIMFQLLLYAVYGQYFFQLNYESIGTYSFGETDISIIPFFGFLIPLASAYRLAKFNIDERQTNSFIGLPTPAFSLLVISFPLILNYSNMHFVIELIRNPYFLLAITVLGCYLLNAELPLFSLKMKDYSLKNNFVVYIFLLLSLVMLFALKTVAIPIIILLYVLISIIDNSTKKTPI